jgi:hypothetical protein
MSLYNNLKTGIITFQTECKHVEVANNKGVRPNTLEISHRKEDMMEG